MSIRCQFLFIFATLVHHSGASICGAKGEYAGDGSSELSIPTNSTEYTRNLYFVFGQLPTKTNDIAVYNLAYLNSGVEPNAAYAQARCIWNVNNYKCLDCIKNATALIKKDCSWVAVSALLWYRDSCMVQYSNHNMLGIMQMRDDMILITNDSGKVEPTSSADTFNRARTKLFNLLAENATTRQLFVAGKLYDGLTNKTIYGAAQCAGNMDSDLCSSCLAIIRKKLGEYFYGKVGGSIVGPSCNFRYEVYNFTETTFVNLHPPSSAEGANKSLLVIYILAPLAIISIITFVGIYLLLRKKKHKKPITDFEIVGKISDEDDSSSRPDINTEETLQYDLSSISAATKNFSEAYKLGQGGFGTVYKGKLQNGEEIAVKRLSQSSKQGELEFTNEVTLLAKLQHRNLVRLLGFCLQGKERLLIYEFVANSSLDNYIFDPIKRAHLNWDQFYKIIGGVARGLLYLHEDSRLRIVHRDLKSSNVLLDNEMTPKIADFGMARLFLSDETQGSTSKIVGTYGYMAPEYLMHGLFSTKSDVFSFGVLILEIICGHRNTSFLVGDNVENLLSFVWKSWQEGTVSDMIDPALRSETSDAERCIRIGLLCSQEDATQRPTMASVVNMLSNTLTPLTDPSKPFSQQCSINQNTSFLKNYDSGWTCTSSGSKNKSSSSWTDTELHPR